MKNTRRLRENELDVDFIGGDGPLSPEDEKLISEFIQQRKLERQRLADEKKAAAKAKRVKADA
ncbi:MAG: hypothetical protein IPP17_24605 [Bacteroidetes bacterium]|nr:hypothetical protein [Bacteroidota bacterium]